MWSLGPRLDAQGGGGDGGGRAATEATCARHRRHATREDVHVGGAAGRATWHAELDRPDDQREKVLETPVDGLAERVVPAAHARLNEGRVAGRVGAELDEKGASVARAQQSELCARRQRLHRRHTHERLEKVLKRKRQELPLSALALLVDDAQAREDKYERAVTLLKVEHRSLSIFIQS